jgi:hypothetical protein
LEYRKLLLRGGGVIKDIISSLLKFLPDYLYVQLYYFAKAKKIGNFKKPKTFNEKINWRKLYDHNPLYTKLSDKYAVREYIAEKIGEEHLVPLLGVYNSVDEIDFNILPNQFVLKCTHDCASVIICKDKQNFDFKQAKSKLSKCLKKNFYWRTREWQYKDIEPKIIAEQYLVDESKIELKDYKIYCFRDKIACIEVMFNRFSSVGLKINIYDTDWNLLPLQIKCPNDPNVKIEKPEELEKMLFIAKILANDFSFVRVDFYVANNKIYFGEMTFTPGGTFNKFTPSKYDRIFGDMWKI